jgi:hypothetical protein
MEKLPGKLENSGKTESAFLFCSLRSWKSCPKKKIGTITKESRKTSSIFGFKFKMSFEPKKFSVTKT